MLDVETRGSQSLLNVRAFADPTAYKLKVKRPGSDEQPRSPRRSVWRPLTGSSASRSGTSQRRRPSAAAFERDSEKAPAHERPPQAGDIGLRRPVLVPHRDRRCTPDGRRTLVIWRKLSVEPEQDNLVLDEWFTQAGILGQRIASSIIIYVNGGNNLENLKTPDDLWKVRLIEEDFHRLMFEMEGE